MFADGRHNKYAIQIHRSQKSGKRHVIVVEVGLVAQPRRSATRSQCVNESISLGPRAVNVCSFHSFRGKPGQVGVQVLYCRVEAPLQAGAARGSAHARWRPKSQPDAYGESDLGGTS